MLYNRIDAEETEKKDAKKKKKKVDGTAESAASGTRTPASKVSTLAFCS
jgi:hypothetical protein